MRRTREEIDIWLCTRLADSAARLHDLTPAERDCYLAAIRNQPDSLPGARKG